MSELQNLSWSFPLEETSTFVADNWNMIFPIVAVVLGVLLALLVVDGIVDVLLKLAGFTVSRSNVGVNRNQSEPFSDMQAQPPGRDIGATHYGVDVRPERNRRFQPFGDEIGFSDYGIGPEPEGRKRRQSFGESVDFSDYDKGVGRDDF